ncbi:P-loop containing nucleoside triphosphate hydrolase [Micractinium conductrix]|uniref:P-loop containing nucleoside triphosphate hydrolase n=1 Tax=Micractinium conductrix TaxID=554055 RepID=A0A2P6V1Z9_9CHLO|nr:P-loop containing nucleoside triphosphate hydrolase [Micractinium conductrix]|eukprot:PSC68119.1 P-loop containing nucleoside triphosphate hydrolase [Micractinium conductrix]
MAAAPSLSCRAAPVARRAPAPPVSLQQLCRRPVAAWVPRSSAPSLLSSLRDVRRRSAARDSLCDDEDCLAEEDGSVIVRDDLDALLQVLPLDIREPLVRHPQRASLLEVVLDLGRRPEARFLGEAGGQFLREAEITKEDLAHAEEALGDFGGDNRAGVEGTLHRISAIRNRKGSIVGLTCRVGRAVTGHIDMIRDILDVPNSVLFLGRPGVGKTTVIREMARVLSDELHKRVVIVDTSNEIGGDGDVPHPAIGGARRMQVPDPSQQHKIMIEAVENHMPEVVIVDEIGTEAEALACRTIAERGVQLIGTAHGQLLENLIKNPTLSDLVGGICSVTLGDDEARSRGTQKSVLERKAPPTFPLVIEMRDRAYWVMHWVEDSVDCLLTGKVPIVQVRRRDAASKKVVAEERRYDAEDRDAAGSPAPPASPAAGGVPRAATTGDAANNISGVFDSMFGYAPASFGNSYGAADTPDRPASSGARAAAAGAGADPYSWANRLRDIPDEDALAELSMLGYTDGFMRRGGDKFSFANGTGTSKKGGKRRPSVGRAIPRRRR